MSDVQLLLVVFLGLLSPLITLMGWCCSPNGSSGAFVACLNVAVIMTVNSISLLWREIYRLRDLLDEKTEKTEQPTKGPTR